MSIMALLIQVGEHSEWDFHFGVDDTMIAKMIMAGIDDLKLNKKSKPRYELCVPYIQKI
jgi:hypothetical protein